MLNNLEKHHIGIIVSPKDILSIEQEYVRYLSREEYQLKKNKLPPDNFEFPIISKYNKLGQDVQNDGLLVKKKFAYSQSRMVPINRFCTWLMSKLEKEPNYLLS